MTMRERPGGRPPADMRINPIGPSTLPPDKQILADKAAKMYMEYMEDHAKERMRAISERRKTPAEATVEYQRKSKNIMENIERQLKLRDNGLKLESNGTTLSVRKLEPHERLRSTTTQPTPPSPPSSGSGRDIFKKPILTKDKDSRVLSPSVMEAQQAVGHFMNRPPMHKADPQYKFGRELLDDVRNMRSMAIASIDKRVLEDLERNMARVVEGRKMPRDAVEMKKQQEAQWRRV